MVLGQLTHHKNITPHYQPVCNVIYYIEIDSFESLLHWLFIGHRERNHVWYWDHLAVHCMMCQFQATNSLILFSNPSSGLCGISTRCVVCINSISFRFPTWPIFSKVYWVHRIFWIWKQNALLTQKHSQKTRRWLHSY